MNTDKCECLYFIMLHFCFSLCKQLFVGQKGFFVITMVLAANLGGKFKLDFAKSDLTTGNRFCSYDGDIKRECIYINRKISSKIYLGGDHWPSVWRNICFSFEDNNPCTGITSYKSCAFIFCNWRRSNDLSLHLLFISVKKFVFCTLHKYAKWWSYRFETFYTRYCTKSSCTFDGVAGKHCHNFFDVPRCYVTSHINRLRTRNNMGRYVCEITKNMIFFGVFVFADVYFVPVVTFLLHNLAEFVGRTVSAKIRKVR